MKSELKKVTNRQASSESPEVIAAFWSKNVAAGETRFRKELVERVQENDALPITLPVKVSLLAEEWERLCSLAEADRTSLDEALSVVIGNCLTEQTRAHLNAVLEKIAVKGGAS